MTIRVRIFLLIIFLTLLVHHTFIKNYELTIVGYILQADSIGKQSIDVYRMVKDEVKVNFKHDREVDTKDLGFDEIIATHNLNISLGNFVLLEMCFQHAYEEFEYYWNNHIYNDDSWNRVPRDKQIIAAYTMLESSRIHDEWVRIINTFIDMVIVPDKAVEQAYIASGVNKPIFVLPLPFNYAKFAKNSLKFSPSKPFVFMNLSSGAERKNIPKTIEAFALAFGDNPDVKLEINTRQNMSLYTMLQIENIIKKYKLSNVYITKIAYDEKNYVDKMLQADVYLSLSKGEGFSIQPRESMAAGIPVITTDAMAQKTIAETGNVVIVPANIEEPAYYDHIMSVAGSFYDFEVNDAAEAMKYLYNNYQEFTNKHSQTARDWTKQYDYTVLKPYYISMVKPKSVIMGSENKIEIDKITTNSPELFARYKKILSDNGISIIEH